MYKFAILAYLTWMLLAYAITKTILDKQMLMLACSLQLLRGAFLLSWPKYMQISWKKGSVYVRKDYLRKDFLGTLRVRTES